MTKKQLLIHAVFWLIAGLLVIFYFRMPWGGALVCLVGVGVGLWGVFRGSDVLAAKEAERKKAEEEESK